MKTKHRDGSSSSVLPLLALAIQMGVTACTGDTSQQDRDGIAALPTLPAGLEMPFVERPACPGEGCSFGDWLACDTVRVYTQEGDTTRVAYTALPGDPLPVETGAVLVARPGIVVVEQAGPKVYGAYPQGEIALAVGDTVYVLNYLGEGFFNGWYRDSQVDVEVFWPWENWRVGDDYDYPGRVLQEAETAFWVKVVDPARGEGFVLVDEWSSIAATNSLDPDPARCY